MACATVTVKLADLAPVQRLIVAAAGVLDGIDVKQLRALHVDGSPFKSDHAAIERARLAELLAALEGLEAKS